MTTPEEAREIADNFDDVGLFSIADMLRDLADQVEQYKKDAERLDWIELQGDEFSSCILQDCPGDGDYHVSGSFKSGEGKTFREAIDKAMKG